MVFREPIPYTVDVKEHYRAARLEAIFRKSATAQAFHHGHDRFLMPLAMGRKPRHGGWSHGVPDPQDGWIDCHSGTLFFSLLEENGRLAYLFWFSDHGVIER